MPTDTPLDTEPDDTGSVAEPLLQSKLKSALESLLQLHTDPSEDNLHAVNVRLGALGLPNIDTTPGEYDPFADPRMGATDALDKVKIGAAAIDPVKLEADIVSVDNTAGSSERWAAVFGTILTTALRVGAAFAA